MSEPHWYHKIHYAKSLIAVHCQINVPSIDVTRVRTYTYQSVDLQAETTTFRQNPTTSLTSHPSRKSHSRTLITSFLFWVCERIIQIIRPVLVASRGQEVAAVPELLRIRAMEGVGGLLGGHCLDGLDSFQRTFCGSNSSCSADALSNLGQGLEIGTVTHDAPVVGVAFEGANGVGPRPKGHLGLFRSTRHRRHFHENFLVLHADWPGLEEQEKKRFIP